MFGRVPLARVDPWVLGMSGLAAFAMALRLAAADQQSAYMDEGTNVLTGRILIEQHAIYAEILNWSYGSLLWPLLAGVADELGGLRIVRGLTAVCGVLMVLATAAVAAQLVPETATRARRRVVALVAGGIMAVAPTAIGVGRFGTYDALAGAAFMLGLTLLVPAQKPIAPLRLLLASALLFVAFLAKYLVAIYFPFICVYVVLAALVPRLPVAVALRNFMWFVVPLSAACAVYALVFLSPLLMLLGSSLHYGDLKSPDPLREYVWTRPELWLLAAAAAVGFRYTAGRGRLVAVGGAAIIMAFQLAAHPDFDFWKHSIYVIYFLAPLAALTWLAVPQNTGTWRVLAVVAGGLAAVWAWSPTIHEANRLIDFYPNLNPSIEAIDANIAGSALVLTDDTALRYYLYPQIPADHVVGPLPFPTAPSTDSTATNRPSPIASSMRSCSTAASPPRGLRFANSLARPSATSISPCIQPLMATSPSKSSSLYDHPVQPGLTARSSVGRLRTHSMLGWTTGAGIQTQATGTAGCRWRPALTSRGKGMRPCASHLPLTRRR